MQLLFNHEFNFFLHYAITPDFYPIFQLAFSPGGGKTAPHSMFYF